MVSGISNLFHTYQHWTIWVWYGLLALIGIQEILGLLRFQGAIPLTWVIRGSIPEWLRWMLLGWALYHFGILTNTK